MMRFTTFSIFAATIALVNAHGSISVPKVVFQDPPNKNAPSCLPKGPAGPYNGDHVLKDLADQNGSRCGKTDGNAPVQPIPADGIVKFDISAQHIGPCEIWLDNDRVVYEKECWTTYPNHQIPVDFSKCKSGKCQLRWVWLAGTSHLLGTYHLLGTSHPSGAGAGAGPGAGAGLIDGVTGLLLSLSPPPPPTLTQLSSIPPGLLWVASQIQRS